MEYGVRFRMAKGRKGETITNAKFFESEQKRTRWCEKFEQDPRFIEFTAWLNPERPEPVDVEVNRG